MKQFTGSFLLHICLIIFVMSCDKTPLMSTINTENEEYVGPDTRSGIFHVEGSRVTTNMCWICTVPDTQPTIDTTYISFDIKITTMISNPDSALIDTSSYEDVYTDGSTIPYQFVKIHGDNIWYDYIILGSRYQGNGSITEEALQLSTYYGRRGLKIEMNLAGALLEEIDPDDIFKDCAECEDLASAIPPD